MSTVPPLALMTAEADDLDALLELERVCFSHPWTAGHFKDALRDERQRVLVLRTPRPHPDPTRGVLAYCVVQWVADELHVHNLAVHPDWRRRGLARRLLPLALHLGQAHGARRTFLEVRPSNAAALALYESHGFRTVAVRPRYYEHPIEDGFVLEKALW
jgi:ribosomal-protein-alanine N-acetyltransferase